MHRTLRLNSRRGGTYRSNTTETSSPRPSKPSKESARSERNEKRLSGRTGALAFNQMGLESSDEVNRMSTSAPASLERDALEVSRGAHLLGQTPSASTQRAIEAAAKRIKIREARKLARANKRTSAVPKEDVEMVEDEGEPSLVNAVAAALAQPIAAKEDTREKIKVKSKVRKSALVPAGANAMSMDMS